MSLPWWRNTETWTMKSGLTVHLEDMDPTHRQNVINHIMRRGERIRQDEILITALAGEKLNGEMSQQLVLGMLEHLEEVPLETFVSELPLVRRLRELNENKESTNMAALTPYDEGTRAEPHAWAIPKRDAPANNYGKVDFDDDESNTIATVWLEREDPSQPWTVRVQHNGNIRTIIEEN